MTQAEQNINWSDTPGKRCYYVDGLRVWAMAAVFILHCSHFFDHIGWHVKNPDAHVGFTLLLLFIHQWTMPLFFLLAGAASWFSLGSRTSKQYAAARFKRLLIPYVFGILLLIPPQKFLEAVTQHGFNGNYLDFLGHYFSKDTLWIGPSLNFFGHYGHHLWFLGFLTVFSMAALPLFKALRKEKARQVITKWGDFFSKKGRIFLLLLPLAVVQITLRPLFPDYLNWADTIYWALFFVYGYIFFLDARFQETMVKYRNIALIAGILGFLVVTVGLYVGRENFSRMAMNPGYSLLSMGYQLLCSINTWVWLIFILGTGKKYMDKTSKTLKYSNEAVLPFYILHQTVILIIGFYVVQWNLPMVAKFGVIMITSFMAIMTLYEPIKRFTPTRFLFGMQSRRDHPINGEQERHRLLSVSSL
jgi:glucan biosynthesis protein C